MFSGSTAQRRCRQLIVVACVTIGITLGCGRGRENGVQPTAGFDTKKVDYRPKLTDDMEIAEFPAVDPRKLPVTVPTHEFTKPIRPGQKTAFVGLVVPYDAGTEGTIVRVDLHRRVAEGQFDNESSVSGMALKNEKGQLSFRLIGNAPTQVGDYEYTLRTIGPSASPTNLDSLKNLDAFLHGEIHVR